MENDCKESISAVIDQEIIPRLLQAHHLDPTTAAMGQDERAKPASHEVIAFAELCISGKPGEAQAFANKLLQQGLLAETIFLELIGPAARYLGEQWEQDLCDFVQVTQGLIRMHEVTHRLGYEHLAGPQEAGINHRIILASAPGSQHILGPVMVAGFFRKAGWQVVLEISTQKSSLMHTVSHEWFDLLGLSVSTQAQREELPGLLQSIQANARNKKIGILLGGSIFGSDREGSRPFGLGGAVVCNDPQEALAVAQSLIEKS